MVDERCDARVEHGRDVLVVPQVVLDAALVRARPLGAVVRHAVVSRILLQRQLVLVYRGLHCPVCRGYLKRVEELKDAFAQARAEVIAVSADPREKAERMVADQGLTFPVAYDLSVDRMREWGLYISKPRSADETDRPFAEPGLFGINENGVVHLIDISNTPFNRADLAETVDTVEWVRENDYPIRGTL